MFRENVEKLIAETAGVRIVPATKTVPSEIIGRLPALGIREAGENRVQELLAKYGEVKGVDWHFIGRLQTNKVKYIADKVVMIQSLDRRELADEIEKRCAALNRVMDCLIEVNAGGETSKGGVLPEELDAFAVYLRAKPHIRVKGLMSVPPAGAGDEPYRIVRELFLTLKKNTATADILSMGMSGDYRKAIEFGANMIRPGRLIFGERIYNGEGAR